MALIKSVRGFTPQWGDHCYLSENSTLVGDVILGNYCSVWFNAVIRGDVNSIRIGDYVNIQDGAIIHATYEKAATYLGHHVSIGHRAIIHGCTIHDHVLIGMGAIIMDHAIVPEHCLVGAGALVPEKMCLESGFIYTGIPAKKLKPLDKENMHFYITRTAENYVKYASWFSD